MPICTRPSCGEDFASSSPCTHHPGQPIFHEGQKSWSCCQEVNKPVLDFDDFVKIRGCTTVEGHSDVKPVKPAATGGGASAGTAMEGVKLEGGKEVYGAAPAAASPSSSAANTTTTPTVPAAAVNTPPQPYVEPEDPEGAAVPSGATCKRPGCGATFQGEAGGSKRDKSSEECRYHKGAPIFHEGSKGYLCCKRRVLEFSEFLKIEPCTTSSKGHLFLQPAKRAGASSSSAPSSSSSPSSSASASHAGGDDVLKARGMGLLDGEEEADCRMDHYETPDEVRMTVYCKGVRMEQSSVHIDENDILLSLSLPPLTAQAGPDAAPRRHLLHLPLYAPIRPHPTSSYTVSPSKIKIDFVLRKSTPGVSWPTLVKGGVGGGYGLTFGRK